MNNTHIGSKYFENKILGLVSKLSDFKVLIVEKHFFK